MVIAIDGPAGAGKSTLARRVAEALGFTYLDTGAMYRCVALAATSEGVDLEDEAKVGELAAGIDLELRGPHVLLGGRDVSEEIRTPEITAAASKVSAQPRVREAMVEMQRRLIASGRYVAEGRDIGTKVSPDAPLKIFLTADSEERARRRSLETGESFEAVLESMRERDARDVNRKHGTLVPAEDAIQIDTTSRPIDEIVSEVVDRARAQGLA
jgi:cytidylate kinase